VWGLDRVFRFVNIIIDIADMEKVRDILNKGSG